MKKAHPKKPIEILASELENIVAGPSPQKIFIADECGDTLWDEVLKQDENNLPSKDNKQNNQPVEDLNKLNDG